MKRSKTIQLVLITAALASCHRNIIPSDPTIAYAKDSTLVAEPAQEDNTYYACCDEIYNSLWNYSFSPYGPTCYLPPHAGLYPYYPGNRYKKGAFWQKGQHIVRGGLGKSGGSVAS
jgi:hypothetical protein